MSLSAEESDLLGALETRLPDMRRDLERLVAQNSFTTNKQGVDAVGRMVGEELEGLGMRVGEVVSGDYGRILVGRRLAPDAPRLLLLGHLDTVHPPESAFQALQEGPEARLLGPGAADMKGGLVVMLSALRALERAGILDGIEVTAVLSSEEEVGSPMSAGVILPEAADSQLCLCFECGSPTAAGGSTIVTSRKGAGLLDVHAQGQPAHAGIEPEAGASAVRELAHKVIALEALNDSSAGVAVTVGLFSGGTSANTVPAEASLTVDYRFADEERGEEVKAAIIAACQRAHVVDSEGQALVTTKVENHVARPPMERTEAVAAWAGRIQGWGREIGLEIEEESRGGSSDAAFATHAGCPAICGLGVVGGKIHTSEEWMLEQSLVDRSRLAALIMARFREV